MNWLAKIWNKLFPHIVEASYKDGLMTLKYSDGDSVAYQGSCTVWHKYPMMERCSTLKEMELYDILTYIKTHGNPYPLSHTK